MIKKSYVCKHKVELHEWRLTISNHVKSNHVKSNHVNYDRVIR